MLTYNNIQFVFHPGKKPPPGRCQLPATSWNMLKVPIGRVIAAICVHSITDVKRSEFWGITAAFSRLTPSKTVYYGRQAESHLPSIVGKNDPGLRISLLRIPSTIIRQVTEKLEGHRTHERRSQTVFDPEEKKPSGNAQINLRAKEVFLKY